MTRSQALDQTQDWGVPRIGTRALFFVRELKLTPRYFSNADCKGWALDGGYYVLNPGRSSCMKLGMKKDLRVVGYANLEQKGFNDVMSSFKCTYSYQ